MGDRAGAARPWVAAASLRSEGGWDVGDARFPFRKRGKSEATTEAREAKMIRPARPIGRRRRGTRSRTRVRQRAGFEIDFLQIDESDIRGDRSREVQGASAAIRSSCLLLSLLLPQYTFDKAHLPKQGPFRTTATLHNLAAITSATSGATPAEMENLRGSAITSRSVGRNRRAVFVRGAHQWRAARRDGRGN
jgi:hypothetical protein